MRYTIDHDGDGPVIGAGIDIFARCESEKWAERIEAGLRALEEIEEEARLVDDVILGALREHVREVDDLRAMAWEDAQCNARHQ